MYSGFITPKTAIPRLGIHQRFDLAAYKMVQPYLPASFPKMKDIYHFEGYNGPDGIKVKSLGVNDPSHMYDPLTDTGHVPRLINNHYQRMVQALKEDDTIRAAFDASWMAHYIGDGMTPAHHWPFDDAVHEARELTTALPSDATELRRLMAKGRTSWALWGTKGHYTTHFNFEMGIAFALMVSPIKPKFNEAVLVRAHRQGHQAFFKEQAREVAALNLYERFMKEGWNADIAAQVKNRIAPAAAATIGYIWLLAILEAGQQLASVAPPDNG
jgi:hypothetical protein